MVIDMELSVLSESFKNKDYFSQVFSFLKPEHFISVENGTIFSVMSEFVGKNNSAPSIKDIGLMIKNSPTIKENIKKQTIDQLKLIAQEPENNPQFFLKETEKWLQRLELQNAIFKSVDIIKSDAEFEPIVGLISDALKINFDVNTGMKYNTELKHRLDYYHRKLQGFDSGVNSLNKLLGGGFLKKTLNIFVAPSHGGKTAALLNAASINTLKKEDVLFISLEMTEEEIAKRIDANILDLNINDFWKTPNKVFEDKFNAIAPNLGKLVIKEYPSGTFNTMKLESLLNDLEKESNFRPTIICIDYLTLLSSSRTTLGKAGGTYTYYKLIAEELHGFAKRFDKIIITAAQLNRGAFGNLEADMESVADSIGIIQTADTAIAMLSNDNLKANNQMVLKTIKNRNTGRLDSVMVQTDFPKMKFVDLALEDENLVSGSLEGVTDNFSTPGLDLGGFNF